MNFDKATIKVYGTQRRKEKYIEISPKILNKIKQYEKQLKETKSFLSNNNNFKWIIYFWSVYIYEWRETITRKFKSNFKEALTH